MGFSIKVQDMLVLLALFSGVALGSSNFAADDRSISKPHWCQPRNVTCICGKRLKIISIPPCKMISNGGTSNCTDCLSLSAAVESCSTNAKFCHNKMQEICKESEHCRCFPRFNCHTTTTTRNNIRKRQADKGCPKPSDPDNGKAEFEFDVSKVGDAVKYRCNAGFTMLGSTTRHCNDNGRWSGEKPTCEKLCSFPSISNQDGLSYVENPGVKDNLRTTSGSIVLAEIEFSCSPGYTLKGSLRIRCTGGGTWDRDPPSCVKGGVILCPAPESPANGRQVAESLPAYESGNIVNFMCNSGFRLVGQSLIVCTDSGAWSSEVPKCEGAAVTPTTTTRGTTTDLTPGASKFCPRPQEIKFGKSKIKINSDFQDTRPENMFEIGASVEFSCQHPYELHGQSEQFCLSSGHWSGQMPECKPACGKGVEPKTPHVVGGKAAIQNGYPWQVAMTTYSQKAEIRFIHCGGSVLSDRWVVTAAHCLTESLTSNVRNASNFLLFFGKHFADRNIDDNNVISRRAAQFVIHPDYNPWTFDSDVGLVMLDLALIFNAVVLPICLPPSNSLATFQTGNKGVVTGWGYTDTKSTEVADVLMMLELPIVNSTKCEESYQRHSFKTTVTDNMFCAGADEGGKNTCQGDSGGPMAFYEKGRYYLEGLISWGNKDDCAGAGFFGGFVRVRNFVPWITIYVGR